MNDHVTLAFLGGVVTGIAIMLAAGWLVLEKFVKDDERSLAEKEMKRTIYRIEK